MCLFQFPTVWVFHFGLVFLQVVAFHHFNVPRHAALSLCLSHPSPLAVCATVRECCLCAMLPEKVAPVSCCRLLSLWVWYYPCWYPHTHTPSRTHVLRYIRPLYSSTLCSFICCGGFLFCCLDSIPSGVVGARTCGVLHTHTQIFVGRICLHASYLNCREPNSGNINICPLSSSCEENRCMSCGAGNVTSRKKRILSDSSCQEISFKRGSMWTLHILQTYRPVKLHQTEVLFHIKGNKIVLRHKAKLCTVKVVING